MTRTTKRYRAATGTAGYEKLKSYAVSDALDILGKFPKAKFDETVEMAIRLGIDTTKADQQVRGSVSLPKGIGKTRTVIVFAEGEHAEAAAAAGADEVGGEDLAARIQEGWMDFDVCIAHPGMMRVVGKLGRVLGPQGKMPSPKSGTVTPRVGEAVTEFKAGKVEFKADKTGNVHVPVGKRSFSDEDLEANIRHFFEFIKNMKPAAVKGTYIKRVAISASMTPGLRLDLN